MCLPDLENLTFSIPIFCLISHPSVYHFWKKAPNFDQLGAFYNNLRKIHPVLYNLGSLVSDENPPIAIPNFMKKCPEKQAHNMHHIPCQCENPLVICCPLLPPNEITLCTEVYGEPPFWVPVRPPSPPPPCRPLILKRLATPLFECPSFPGKL